MFKNKMRMLAVLATLTVTASIGYTTFAGDASGAYRYNPSFYCPCF